MTVSGSSCLFLALALTACDASSGALLAEPADPVANERRARGPYAADTLYVEPGGNAADQADAWRTSDPAGAAVMDQLALLPVSLWVGDWNGDPTRVVDDAITRAGAALRVLTVYDIPNRDCGAWSSGGAANRAEYERFVGQVAAGIDGRRVIVVLEPDALALVDCLDAAGEAERSAMLADAVDTLTAAGAYVYLDAGDSAWIPAADMAGRLLDAGVNRAAGFALNVSHTETSTDENDYAQELRAILGSGAHFVVDTGRNGLGPTPDHAWCNPLGRANGHEPTLRTRAPGLDAALWIKPPGESDGSCNGGPPAGAWWADYALDLGVRAGY